MAKASPWKRASLHLIWAIPALLLLAADRSAIFFTTEPSIEGEAVPAISENILAETIARDSPALDLAPPSQEGGLEAAAEKKLRKLFSEGLFAEAMQLVGEQKSDPTLNDAYKLWLMQQAPILKLGWAWQKIRNKNCSGALPLLDEVIAAGPQALALKGIGYCYLQGKDWWTAGSYLERYLESKPTDPEAYILLAETKESLGSYDEALLLTQKARELESLTGEEAKDLQKRESSLSVRAKEGFDQGRVEVGPFILRYQLPDHQHLVQASLEHMQDTVQVLAQQLGLSYPQEGIEVIFHRAENFQGAANSPHWAGGIYDGRIRIPIQGDQEMSQEFAGILRHEVTHALLAEHSQRRTLPTWFQEGLAQVAQCPRLCWSSRMAAYSNHFLPAERLAGSFISLPQSEAQIAYKQSFFLMQVLYRKYHTAGIKQIIEQIPHLTDVSSDSLLQQIGMSFEDLHGAAAKAWKAEQAL